MIEDQAELPTDPTPLPGNAQSDTCLSPRKRRHIDPPSTIGEERNVDPVGPQVLLSFVRSEVSRVALGSFAPIVSEVSKQIELVEIQQESTARTANFALLDLQKTIERIHDDQRRLNESIKVQENATTECTICNPANRWSKPCAMDIAGFP